MLNAYLWNLAIASFINIILYACDKRLADTHRPRLCEYYMLIVTAFGGAFGAIVGMVLFNHKSNASSKWYFLIGVLGAALIQSIIALKLLGVVQF